MAYNRIALHKYAYLRGAPPAFSRRLWGYVSFTDTLDAIAAPGYMIDTETNLVVGDRMFVEGSNGQREMIVTSITGGNIVLGNTDEARRLDLLEALIVQLQVAGHGGMLMNDGPQADADFDINFQPIDQMNVINVEERGVDLTVDTGEFSVTIGGIWKILLYVNISHNSISNASRTIFIRTFNVTDNDPGPVFPIGIGRNDEDTNTVVSIMVDIAQDDIGDTYRFDIGGGDTLTTVVWNQVSVGFTYQGRLGSLTLPIVGAAAFMMRGPPFVVPPVTPGGPMPDPG